VILLKFLAGTRANLAVVVEQNARELVAPWSRTGMYFDMLRHPYGLNQGQA
jgi:hypothetical protein